MIDPVTAMVASELAISVGSNLMGFAAQKDAAESEEEYNYQVALAQQRQMQENARRAMRSYFLNIDREQVRMLQEREAAAQKIEQSALAEAAARGTARVAAGEAGVAGNSVEALQQDFERQQAVLEESVLTNLDWKEDQSRVNMEAYRNQALARIGSVQGAPEREVSQPSLLASLIGVAGDAAGTFGRYRKDIFNSTD